MMIAAPELQMLCAICDAAGREVMAVYSTDFAAWQKDDASPLTQADLRSDAVIRDGLQRHFQACSSCRKSRRRAASPPSRRAFFLVDPLDGTKEFLKRNDEFTVNIALVHRGEPVAGVVLAPALGELYFAARGLGAWKRSEGGEAVPLQVARPG